MLNKTAASETITNIEHIMYGDGFSELVKKVSEDEHTPVQHTFYFSHLPEDMLKSISSSKIDSTINEKMTKSRRGLVKVLYASMCSFIFASTNVVAYTRMMSSFRTIKDKLSNLLRAEKGRETPFEAESREFIMLFLKSLIFSFNSSSETLDS